LDRQAGIVYLLAQRTAARQDHSTHRILTATSEILIEPGRAVARGGGPRSDAHRRPLVWLFAAASFVGAALVVAKMILPVLGGSPAVWNTALVFFQGMLLAGYAYAHVSYRALGARRQPILHLVVLVVPLAALPMALPDWTPPSTGVSLWVLGLLAVAAAAPYFAVATAGPLLQRWFSATGDPDALDPYFLYATGNAGSMVGLLAYPFVLEPLLPLGAQARVWAGGYLVFLVLTAWCAAVLLRASRAAAAAAPSPAGSGEGSAAGGAPAAPAVSLSPLAPTTRLRWVALAFVPSSLLLGVTTYVTTDVAAVPLLWVVPLALYLATFILSFSPRAFPFAAGFQSWLPVLVLPAVLAASVHLGRPVLLVVGLHLAVLFAVGAACHSRLAGERPPVDRLTEFYLLISVGGVLGGMFNALVAPALFDSLIEYPLVLALSLAAARVPVPAFRRVFGLSAGILPAGIAFLALGAGALWLLASGWAGTWSSASAFLLLAAAAFAYRQSLPFTRRVLGVTVLALALLPALRPSLHTERTFFGMHRVSVAGGWHLLSHGTTVHGAQNRDAELVGEPTTYYHRDGPAGDVFATRTATDRLAFVGLGTGALAAYAAPGQSATFFEIDPAVVRIARDPSLFSYLELSAGDIGIVLGDGRRTLALEPPAAFDVIVLDAFSSDAIPVHLVTLEAVELYLERLRPGGILAFHITNRYVDLEPVLGEIAAALDLQARVRGDRGDGTRARMPSRWMVLAANAGALGAMADDERWAPPGVPSRAVVWTDDFSNILRVLRRW
jgi:SAM-dependent methyltransferase